VRSVIPSSDGRQLVSCSVDQVRPSSPLRAGSLAELDVYRRHGSGMRRLARPRLSFAATSMSSKSPSSLRSPLTLPSVNSRVSQYVLRLRRVYPVFTLAWFTGTDGSLRRCQGRWKLCGNRLARQDDQAVGYFQRPVSENLGKISSLTCSDLADSTSLLGRTHAGSR
jgi:hypothetical protein